MRDLFIMEYNKNMNYFAKKSRPVVLALFVCLFIDMSACSFMRSYLCDYLQKGNTLSYLLPSKQVSPLYIRRESSTLKLLSLSA